MHTEPTKSKTNNDHGIEGAQYWVWLYFSFLCCDWPTFNAQKCQDQGLSMGTIV